MKNTLPWQLLTLVVALLPVAYQCYVWPALPAEVPTHFGFDGQVNGYTHRDQLWLFTLALPVGLAVLMAVLPRLDPKRRLDGSTANFQKLRLAVVGLISGLAVASLYAATHSGFAPGRGVVVLVGLGVALMGNYLTTVQPNYFVGIRTPWTLESPLVWARTHRVGGVGFCVAGLLLAGAALVLPLAWVHPAVLVLMLGVAVFSYGYSYWAFRQQETAGKPA